MSEGQQETAILSTSEGETLVTVTQVSAEEVAQAGTTTMALVQLPGGQTVQVQSVIQAAQSSVIQSPQIQTIQVATISDGETSQESGDSSSDTQKRREILSRRPSYRKILNDLSSDAAAVPKIDEEKAEDDGSTTNNIVTLPTPIYQTSTGQYFAIAGGGAIQINGAEGLQALTMAAASGETYQIRTPSGGIPQGMVVATSPASIQSSQGVPEEGTRKREVRLMKNRDAAKECRRRKKEYVRSLENRVEVLEVQNKQLLDELSGLKNQFRLNPGSAGQ
ncbi:cAMP-responsive element modulator-like isoform X4 [Lethenteron reissneri]|uniref:cAMP-responsive element modulator-like isoform X4 n=1 Tax=Lethenteron reissneri TaxID=7753 RepID=UPI002AB708FF|nr:cAMP-responsive element modulator-like isoform X4 [Lethenteron reissneri]